MATVCSSKSAKQNERQKKRTDGFDHPEGPLLPMPSFHTVNFGCRANQADGAALVQELSRCGLEAAGRASRADVVIVNSCTVTAAADCDVRQIVRRIHRQNPAARILVTGCYAQRRPEELMGLAGVRWVVGNSHKTAIASLLCENAASLPRSKDFVPLEVLQGLSGGAFPPAPSSSEFTPQILVGDIFAQQEFSGAPVVGGAAGDRTRPNLKVQDGCNNRCSFCVIPYVRGRSRSLPPAEVIRQVRALCAEGYREVVLSGVNLGRYGRDLPAKLRFPQLVRAILAQSPLERLRLSSVEPMDWSDELLDLMAASERIAQHVHAPLQSGSDRILAQMHRKYRAEHYRARLLAAYERMPNAAFGADVMVGFPGETDEDFNQTRRFIESLPFTYLHVFPFSRRPDTPADKMRNQVQGSVIHERGRILRQLAAEKNRQFRQRQLGRVLKVLTLEETVAGGSSALSDNYLKVFIPGERLPANQLVNVQIVSLAESWLVGKTQW